MDTLNGQIEHNKKQSWLTIGLFIIVINIIIFIVAFVFSGSFSNSTNPEYSTLESNNLLLLILGLELFLALYVAYKYWRSGRDILAANKGQLVTENETNPKLKQVYNIVEEMSLASGLPMPDVYYVPDLSPNAFATGMSPEKSSIAVTRGLIEIMNREELEGVISHEMSHIKNYDIRVSTLAIALSGFISVLGYFMLRSGQVIMRNFYWLSSDDDNDSKSRLVTMTLGASLMLVGGVILIFGVPLSIVLTKMLSRKREALADISGADLTNNPQGLISAFEKLKNPVAPATVLTQQAAQLCLVQPPFGALKPDEEGNTEAIYHKEPWWQKLMDDHPPLDERIANLKKLM